MCNIAEICMSNLGPEGERLVVQLHHGKSCRPQDKAGFDLILLECIEILCYILLKAYYIDQSL